MNDVTMKGLIQREFKVVGTRPLRPDGVDKVTGRAKLFWNLWSDQAARTNLADFKPPSLCPPTRAVAPCARPGHQYPGRQCR